MCIGSGVWFIFSFAVNISRQHAVLMHSTSHDLHSLRIPIDEERVTNGELKALGDLINEIERHIGRSIIEGDGGAGLLAVATARREV